MKSPNSAEIPLVIEAGRQPASVRHGSLVCGVMIALGWTSLIGAQQDRPPANQVESGFRSLISGDGLAGWNGDAEWFYRDGDAIVAGSLDKKIPHNFFLRTDQEYTNFELRLEAKLLGEGDNAGIQFRTQPIPDSHEVSGYQADMGSAWDRPVWGSLYDESRRRKMLMEPEADAVRKVLKKEDWNEFVIRCEGNRIQIWLNGLQTIDYTEEDEKIPQTGIIAVQIHGGAPAEARYRNIRIREL